MIQAPQIVKFYGACLKPKLCIVMEFCEQGSLHDVLARPNLKVGKYFSFILHSFILLSVHYHLFILYTIQAGTECSSGRWGQWMPFILCIISHLASCIVISNLSMSSSLLTTLLRLILFLFLSLSSTHIIIIFVIIHYLFVVGVWFWTLSIRHIKQLGYHAEITWNLSLCCTW